MNDITKHLRNLAGRLQDELDALENDFTNDEYAKNLIADIDALETAAEQLETPSSMVPENESPDLSVKLYWEYRNRFDSPHLFDVISRQPLSTAMKGFDDLLETIERLQLQGFRYMGPRQ